MKIRNVVVAGALAALLTAPSFAGYQVRLWFENLTRGTSNTGALLSFPGDTIVVKYFFRADDTTGGTEKWGTMQITVDLVGQTVMSDADANTWRTKLSAAFVPAASYPIRIFHQPEDGPMYDWAIDTTDDTKEKITDKGVYALLGVRGDRPPSWNFPAAEIFRFTVRPDAVIGSELRWWGENRVTGTGLSTRILDHLGASVKITDNWIRVVPEPSAFAAIATGLAGLLALRRRK